MLPSGPGHSRAEFGSSRERSKQLTRVPTGGVATPPFSRSYNGDKSDKPSGPSIPCAGSGTGPGSTRWIPKTCRVLHWPRIHEVDTKRRVGSGTGPALCIPKRRAGTGYAARGKDPRRSLDGDKLSDYVTLRSRRQPCRVRFPQGTLKAAHSGSNRRGCYTIFFPQLQ